MNGIIERHYWKTGFAWKKMFFHSTSWDGSLETSIDQRKQEVLELVFFWGLELGTIFEWLITFGANILRTNEYQHIYHILNVWLHLYEKLVTFYRGKPLTHFKLNTNAMWRLNYHLFVLSFHTILSFVVIHKKCVR